MTIVIFMSACAPTYYVIGNVTHRNESGDLMNEYPAAVIATQDYDYGLYRYIEYKSFTGNGFFFNDRSGERKFISGGIIQIDSIKLVRIDEYDKAKTVKKTPDGNSIPDKDDLISEYNNNKRIIEDLSRMKRDAKKSKTGNEQYIKDAKERLRTLRNRQAIIERILYREYGLYMQNFYNLYIRPVAV